MLKSQYILIKILARLYSCEDLVTDVTSTPVWQIIYNHSDSCVLELFNKLWLIQTGMSPTQSYANEVIAAIRKIVFSSYYLLLWTRANILSSVALHTRTLVIPQNETTSHISCRIKNIFGQNDNLHHIFLNSFQNAHTLIPSMRYMAYYLIICRKRYIYCYF